MLRQRADLLDLTHDTIFARDMNDVITYWNRGAEELYGWRRDEAIGKVTHELTQTIFPAPLEQINETLLRTGRWEGELIHTKRDGSKVVVASRWSLQRDEQSKPVAILETNNNITEAKQAEALLAGEKRILEMVASGASLGQILDSLCRTVEEQAKDVLASVLLVEGDCLRHGGAPSLPKAYTDAINGVVIGPSVGSCGTAAYTGKQVIVSDIASDPLWADYREVALAHSLRACWSTPIFSSEGKVIATFAMYYREPHSPTVRDKAIIEQITHLAGVAIQRKLAEDELRESEEKWKAVFENNPTMYFVVDATGITRSVNPFGAEQLGYTTEELVGTPVREIFYGPDRDAVSKNVGRCFDQLNQPMNWEARKVRKDGKVIWVRETGRAVLMKNEPFILVACEDITDRKYTEQELAKTEQRLRTVVANTPLILFALDSQGVFTLSEGKGLDVLGVKPGEVVGQSLFDIYRDEPQILSNIRRALSGEAVTHVVEVNDVVYESHYVPVLDESGEVSGVNGVAINITERLRAEEALQKAQAELAHVARVTTMGELTSSIAHEVNQPLTAIVTSGNASLRWLSNDPPNVEEARELVTRIVKDGHRASEVVGRIRAFFKKASPEKVRIDINNLIKDVIAMVPGELRRNRVQVRTELTDDLPPVIADCVQLQQVLLNLVINGIEAMSNIAGPRELLIRSQKYESGGVLVAVQDNGSGIDEQTATQLFDPFFTTKPSGLGMGLSISKTTIEANGGRLWATSNNGRGATFQFTLPASY
jgi:PAS domain S-box-containing protein